MDLIIVLVIFKELNSSLSKGLKTPTLLFIQRANTKQVVITLQINEMDILAK